MTRSILRRMTLPAPAHLAETPAARAVPVGPEQLAALAAAQASIAAQIDEVRAAVAESTGEAVTAGSDEELEGFTVDGDMLLDARQSYLRPSGYLTRRLTRSARDAKLAKPGAVVEIRLARRPFALVQCKVLTVHKPGRMLDVLVEQGPDLGLAVRVELGLSFPWDVLVRAL